MSKLDQIAFGILKTPQKIQILHKMSVRVTIGDFPILVRVHFAQIGQFWEGVAHSKGVVIPLSTLVLPATYQSILHTKFQKKIFIYNKVVQL